MKEFNIRECQIAEAAAVLALWQAAGATVSLTDTLEDVQGAIASSAIHFLVAEQSVAEQSVAGKSVAENLNPENQVQMIGTLIAGFDGWRGNMYRLVVHPDYRRWGIATALVTEAEARFRQQGVKRITILVE
ncbi:MAG: GNAT family N-acetyltransferase, partial [Elainellaceae cyanobacterium]